MTNFAWLIAAAFPLACFLAVRSDLATIESRLACPAKGWLAIGALAKCFFG